MTRIYPDDPAGPFPEPPTTFEDSAGRTVTVRTVDSDFEALVEMYDAFDPGDRAQGIPPVDAPEIREWLETVLAGECFNVVATHESGPVGHAMLVPDRDDAYELAVFVLHDYQGAGIGTRLLEGLLGHAESQGVERIWLTVERWNEPAIAVYRKLGFEISDATGFEREMAIRLA
jgi:GNAT superfamily N-acetyltransferase